jgi:predicted RNase H-like HicB family nuclease
MPHTTTHKVELVRSEEGYAVLCPDLPGCVSQGSTEEEALANIKDAIKDYLEVVEEMKQRREIRTWKSSRPDGKASGNLPSAGNQGSPAGWL